jgi:hypothetical protein
MRPVIRRAGSREQAPPSRRTELAATAIPWCVRPRRCNGEES